MNTLDAGFYFVEHQNVPMHIGSLAVFEGPAPSYEELLRLYAAKLPLVPRYRQVVKTMPLQVFRPFWADDTHFELRYHLRHAGVPPPGSSRMLQEMASRIFAQKLDRARPLWESWFLEGLEGDRWAIISKVHHCMVDGIGGSDLMAALFDLVPEAAQPVPLPWEPEPGPSLADVVAGGALDTMIWPARQLADLPGFVRRRLHTPADLMRYGRGLGGSARRLVTRSASSLNGPISPHRRWTWTTASLDDVKKIRRALDVTVNDVLLAMITSGFRDLLTARRELEEGVVVRSLVPVSLRGEDEHRPVSNRVSAMLANLPVAEPSPVRRLDLIHAQMEDLKRTSQAVGAEFLTEVLGVGFAAPALLALGSRAAFRIPQPLVQTVTTNVPGPRFPLYIAGRKMTELYPYVPIGDNLRIGIAIFSYLELFSFGVTADYSAVPESDLGILTEGIGRGLPDLLERVKPPVQARPRPSPKPRGAASAASGRRRTKRTGG
ncbi:MAG TPA: wax ester/triacylglycerol synthase family O-acyltransferase [Streptosporangiaceae bacterium]